MITLKTLEDATEQEVFNQVANHLLTQNEKSTNTTGVCLYKSVINGKTLKCAAGCLIGDDEYLSEFENNKWIHLGYEGLVPKYHLNLIRDLQCIHDNYNPNEWYLRLKYLAIKYNLTFNY